MTIKVIETADAAEAFKEIEGLIFPASRNLIFRGHKQSCWRLETTLRRHIVSQRDPLPNWLYDEMLAHFHARLASIGIELPFGAPNFRAQMEFGRHYGVPSPVIDFSYSPFVALFFAFNAVRPNDTDRAVLNCVNVRQLGLVRARDCARSPTGTVDIAEIDKAYHKFATDNHSMFESGYPKDDLRFIRFPATWNRRMQRQMGCFLYDTLFYNAGSHRAFRDLEHYMAQDEVPGEPPVEAPILTKVSIPYAACEEVFSRLDLMGITATHLYDSHEGAAMDVINAFNYNRRSGFAWDIGAIPSSISNFP